MAANGVANSIAYGPDVYGRDDDPELVREAVPFGLKTMEGLLETVPKHRGLLLAACRGFTQYAYAFVQLDADEVEAADYARATELRERALKLFVRGRDYGLRGLELEYRGIGEQLRLEPEAAAARIEKDEVALLYWTAAAWGSALSLGKDRPELLADLPAVRALMQRGLALDEAFEGGAFHEAMIILEALPETMGGSVARAREHYRRAVELSGGTRPGPHLTLAQSVSVMTQDRAEFEQLLEKALMVDPEREPGQRLATLVIQRKARSLLTRVDDFFIAPLDTTTIEENR
jgi:predicted anti-sigma-YlaC factor YlaD